MQILKVFLLFIYLIFLTLLNSAVAGETDSLKTILQSVKNDNDKFDILYLISDIYMSSDMDSSIYFRDKAEELSVKTGDELQAAKVVYLDALMANIKNDLRLGIKLFNKVLPVFEDNEDTRSVGLCYNQIGISYKNLGSFDTSLVFYEKAMDIFNNLNDKPLQSTVIYNIGLANYLLGNYDESMTSYLEAIKIEEELGNTYQVANIYNNLGGVYYQWGNIDKTLEAFTEAARLFEEVGHLRGSSATLNNIGIIYYNQKKYDEAIENFIKSLEIKRKLDFNKGIAQSLANIGAVYKDKGDFYKALEYKIEALEIEKEAGDKLGICESFISIGDIYMDMNNSAKARKFLLDGVEIATQIGAKKTCYNAYTSLADLCKKTGDYKQALIYSELKFNYKDSLLNEENLKQIAEMETRFETEKKEKEIELLNKQRELQDSEISRQKAEMQKQRLLIWSFIAGFVIILVFSIILYRLFLQKKKANRIILQQNEKLKMANEEILAQKEEIESQRDEIITQRDQVQAQKERIEELYEVALARKELLEVQKEEIEDSINYAKRIQQAVLPSKKYSNSILGEHFILYRPKDIVSGDFYWATKTEEWTVITVADCTGHGVPGAFMSMLGVSFLNEIVRKKDVTNSAMVLNQLRESVIEALKQTGEELILSTGKHNDQDSQSSLEGALGEQMKDGLDMSLIAIHKDGRKALWAGANNPLYIIRNVIAKDACLAGRQVIPKQSAESEADCFVSTRNDRQLVQYKGDSMPVAVYIKMDDFTNHEIELNKGDLLYLFTDGYPDQFGGSKGKKLKYKPFKKLLVDGCSLTMSEQKKFLDNALDKWMHDDNYQYEQVDDITIVGIKV